MITISLTRSTSNWTATLWYAPYGRKMIQFDGNVLMLMVPVAELVTTANLVSYSPIESAPPIASLAAIRNWKKKKIKYENGVRADQWTEAKCVRCAQRFSPLKRFNINHANVSVARLSRRMENVNEERTEMENKNYQSFIFPVGSWHPLSI